MHNIIYSKKKYKVVLKLSTKTVATNCLRSTNWFPCHYFFNLFIYSRSNFLSNGLLHPFLSVFKSPYCITEKYLFTDVANLRFPLITCFTVDVWSLLTHRYLYLLIILCIWWWVSARSSQPRLVCVSFGFTGRMVDLDWKKGWGGGGVADDLGNKDHLPHHLHHSSLMASLPLEYSGLAQMSDIIYI